MNKNKDRNSVEKQEESLPIQLTQVVLNSLVTSQIGYNLITFVGMDCKSDF